MQRSKYRNLFKRANGTYYIDYEKDGERRRFSLKTKSLKEAKQRRDDILAERIEITWGKRQQDTSLIEFWKAYSAYAEKHKSRSTCEGELLAWELLIEHTGAKKLGDIKPHHVERFRDALLDGWSREKDEGGKGERTPNTVNRYIGYGNVFFVWAAKHRYFTGKNPFDGIGKLKVSKRPIRFLNVDQRDALIEAASGVHRDIYLFVALCTLAGMRSKEAAYARWEWFDFKLNTITIQQGDDFDTKSRKFRTIPLSKNLRLILDPLAPKERYLIKPLKTGPGHWKTRYNPIKPFQKAAETAGVPWATPHTLRHTFASLLVIHGESIYKVSQWLGHADLKTTQIYAHLMPHDDGINRV